MFVLLRKSQNFPAINKIEIKVEQSCLLKAQLRLIDGIGILALETGKGDEYLNYSGSIVS